MPVIKRTVLEAVILMAVGVALAFGANAVRGSGAVNPTRDYFRIGERPVAVISPQEKIDAPSVVVPDEAGVREDQPAEPDQPSSKHPYQVVCFDKTTAIFKDRYTESGANVFIDCRSRELYEEGHIPGAIHADHYRFEEYCDNVLAAVEGADRVITYCEGGDCEDSIFMCANLVELGVPYDKIYLCPGGWEEWSKNDMPIAKGCEPE